MTYDRLDIIVEHLILAPTIHNNLAFKELQIIGGFDKLLRLIDGQVEVCLQVQLKRLGGPGLVQQHALQALQTLR